MINMITPSDIRFNPAINKVDDKTNNEITVFKSILWLVDPVYGVIVAIIVARIVVGERKEPFF